jgi:4-hydroxythreonine-4-phosphate dehydrogenase
MAAQDPERPAMVAVADPDVLTARARRLGLPLGVIEYRAADAAERRAGKLTVLPIAAAVPAVAGRPDSANGAYVLETLRQASDRCLSGEFDALVTGPVNKRIINEAGIAFSGHTEFLAQRLGAPTPVMMLTNADLRVALVTTHLPLAQVAKAITIERLSAVIKILTLELEQRFEIASPTIAVCGLNPHAGEGGHLGSEEREIIEPVLDELRRQGLRLLGPIPADTAFTPHVLAEVDAVLAMYHDQGLPVIKHARWGKTVNVTLGLPIVRTSVDHGTAFDLAGTGRASPESLMNALALAERLTRRG